MCEVRATKEVSRCKTCLYNGPAVEDEDGFEIYCQDPKTCTMYQADLSMDGSENP
jgi:hypothetical protein